MKKAVCAVMALMIASSLSFAACAEDVGSTVDNPISFSYEDIDETVYDGTWVSTGLGFDVYLPSDWEVSEVTDEMAEQGLAFVAGEDAEKGGANMIITYTQIPEEQAADYDLEKMGAELAAAYTTALYADLNGIPAVIFESDENEISGYAMLSDGGYVITGVISGPEGQYEEYGPYFMNMTMSISPTEEETEAAQ